MGALRENSLHNQRSRGAIRPGTLGQPDGTYADRCPHCQDLSSLLPSARVRGDRRERSLCRREAGEGTEVVICPVSFLHSPHGCRTEQGQDKKSTQENGPWA